MSSSCGILRRRLDLIRKHLLYRPMMNAKKIRRALATSLLMLVANPVIAHFGLDGGHHESSLAILQAVLSTFHGPVFVISAVIIALALCLHYRQRKPASVEQKTVKSDWDEYPGA